MRLPVARSTSRPIDITGERFHGFDYGELVFAKHLNQRFEMKYKAFSQVWQRVCVAGLQRVCVAGVMKCFDLKDEKR